MDRLVGLVKASEPAPGYDEVLVAGELEWRREGERLQSGIPVPVKLWTRLSEIAAELQVPVPTPIGRV
jgi:LDH2 family malate/lactate/ureidoglycolate dehydrogenase